MRRNLLLLTAVVLAAVMLSGCVVWPFGVTVDYKLEKEVFEKHQNPSRVKKNSAFTAEFFFAEEYEEGRTLEAFEIEVSDGTENGVEFEEPVLVTNDDDEVTGIKIEIVSGTKPITVSVLFPEAEADE